MPIDFARGVATTVVNQGLRKVAGNLPGLLGRNKGKPNARDSSDLKDLENAKTSSLSPVLLQFPSDIDSDPGVGNHGHYIIFYIKEFDKTQLKFGDEKKTGQGKKNLAAAEAEMALPEKIKVPKSVGGNTIALKTEELKKQSLVMGKNLLTEAQGYDSRNFVKMENIQNQFKDDTVIQRRQGGGYAQVNHNYGTAHLSNTNNSTDAKPKDPATVEFQEDIKKRVGEEGSSSSVRVTMPSRSRIDTAIAMYMPAQVQVNYGADYQDTKISPLAGAIGQAVGDMSQGMSLSDTYNKVIPMVTDGLQQKALMMGADLLDGIGISGVREAVEIGRAEVIADRMQLAFKGVDRRTFEYTFKMIPKNSREADEIKKIIAAFKFHMMPEYKEGTKRDTLNYPSTFEIEYHYRGKENTYLNRVSECFLEKMGVTYGGDRYKTFDPHNNEGAPPVETSITLAFKEIEIMHREKMTEGF